MRTILMKVMAIEKKRRLTGKLSPARTSLWRPPCRQSKNSLCSFSHTWKESCSWPHCPQPKSNVCLIPFARNVIVWVRKSASCDRWLVSEQYAYKAPTIRFTSYIHQKSKKVPKTVRRTDPDPKSLPIPQKLFRFVSLNLLFLLYISADSASIMHLVLSIYKLCLLAICVCEHHQQQHQ